MVILHGDTVVYQATNTHIHVPPFELVYTFPEPGDYTIFLTSAPTPMRASVDFPPSGVKAVIQVK